MQDDDRTVRSTIARWWDTAGAMAVAFVVWSVVILITIVATAQSGKPWDTFIAAAGAGSQAIFAFMVYRLGREQYAFTQRVTDRQHKIDAYPLRAKAAERLDELAETHLFRPRPMETDEVEAFRYVHMEIARLFSPHAARESFDLYETILEAQSTVVATPAIEDDGCSIVVPGHDGMTEDVVKMMHYAADVFTDLQNILEEEMNIG